MESVSISTVLEWFSKRLEQGCELEVFKTEGPVIVRWSGGCEHVFSDGIGGDLEAALVDAYRTAESQEKSRTHGDLFAAQRQAGG